MPPFTLLTESSKSWFKSLNCHRRLHPQTPHHFLVRIFHIVIHMLLPVVTMLLECMVKWVVILHLWVLQVLEVLTSSLSSGSDRVEQVLQDFKARVQPQVRHRISKAQHLQDRRSEYSLLKDLTMPRKSLKFYGTCKWQLLMTRIGRTNSSVSWTTKPTISVKSICSNWCVK